jgi:hypothetical protein
MVIPQNYVEIHNEICIVTINTKCDGIEHRYEYIYSRDKYQHYINSKEIHYHPTGWKTHIHTMRYNGRTIVLTMYNSKFEITMQLYPNVK